MGISLNNNRDISLVQRRVQQIGKKGSFILTLPKSWCEKHSISSGTSLDVTIDHIREASLMISIPYDRNEQKKEIEISFSDQFELQRNILGRYIDGYEIIKIKDVPESGEAKLEVRRRTRNLTNKLYGCWVSERAGYFELRISSEIVSPVNLLFDLFSVTNLMLRDVMTAYIENDKELAQDIKERDDEADRLYFHIVRTLKALLRDPISVNALQNQNFNLEDSLDYRMISSKLENLADEAVALANVILETQNDIQINKTLTRDLLSISSSITRLLDQSHVYFSDKDYPRALKTLKSSNELGKKIELLKIKQEHPQMIRTITEAIETIIDICDFIVGE